MERKLSQLESQERVTSASASQAVVLRAALRGFTKVTEKLEPASILPMLSECMELFAKVARHNGGELCGADSESVTVAFGLHSVKANGNADAAVRAARQLLEDFEPISDRWHQDTRSRVALSIGIHDGEVLAAALGSSANNSPTLVGDTVNVAGRLANRARAGEAILSASIRKALHDPLPGVELKPLGGLSFAARSQRIDIYCIARSDRLDLGERRYGVMRH